jgi:uncharacterized membrane protein
MRLLRVAAGPFFVFAGAMHFVIPAAYRRIVPPYLPAPKALVYASGVAEIAGGAASLWARLPLQAVFVAWVASAMRHPGSTASRPSGPRLRSADDAAT